MSHAPAENDIETAKEKKEHENSKDKQKEIPQQSHKQTTCTNKEKQENESKCVSIVLEKREWNENSFRFCKLKKIPNYKIKSLIV